MQNCFHAAAESFNQLLCRDTFPAGSPSGDWDIPTAYSRSSCSSCPASPFSHTELESIQEVLSDYRQCHSALIQWIEEITIQQELMKPGQAEDSRVLSEQLSQQTVRQELEMS